jgi:hypothetical protein
MNNGMQIMNYLQTSNLNLDDNDANWAYTTKINLKKSELRSRSRWNGDILLEPEFLWPGSG